MDSSIKRTHNFTNHTERILRNDVVLPLKTTLLDIYRWSIFQLFIRYSNSQVLYQSIFHLYLQLLNTSNI